jgi:parallel beta-helix repeat protein
MPIANVDDAAHLATLTLDPRPSNKETDARYYVENAPDTLDSRGEWYLDRSTNVLSYWPLAGENMQSTEVIAPALVHLVRLQGKPEQHQFVRNVTFRGLLFEHADWSMDLEGYADTQAAMPAPAAIEGIGALDTAIEKCTVTHAGGYAIFFGRGSKRSKLLASELFDLGGGGIKLGEPQQFPDDEEQNYENVVADNHIHDLGLVYAPGIGIWILQSGRNKIVHNHIHDLFYTAISVGWTWGYGENQSKGNSIEYNHIHDVGKEMLSDMGGIYTLGVQPGTAIRNNLIHDISSFTYGGWGIYPDEGSSEMLIENNIVYNCKSAGFHQHYGRENIVRNNIWAFNRENQLMRTRAESHISFTFERNIVYFDQGRLLGSNWNGDRYLMKNNIYFDTRGRNISFAGQSFEDWKRTGRDAGSIIADPLFVNASNFNFSLEAKSPALRMGFQPIDIASVGTRMPAGQ